MAYLRASDLASMGKVDIAQVVRAVRHARPRVWVATETGTRSGDTMVRLRQDDVSWREIDGEMVVLDLKTSKYLTTNGTGTMLLKLLAAERTADELVTALTEAFEIDSDAARQDVRAFLADLSDRGLLVGQ